MSYIEELKEENEKIQERYDLAMDRIERILTEDSILEEKYDCFFRKTAGFLMQIKELAKMVSKADWKESSLEELQQINFSIYEDLMAQEAKEKIIKGGLSEKEGVCYEVSYANPSFVEKGLGKKYGKLLCFLYTELRALVPYAYEQRLFDITIGLELFIQIFNCFEEEDIDTYQEVKEAIYYYIYDYCDTTIPRRTREMLDPSLSFATDIIMDSDLSDLRYLYYFGEYISENEWKVAEFLNTLPQEKIDDMARTYTEGFRMGFVHNAIDLSKKSVVNIRYAVGFERIVKAAIKQFECMGLKPTIYRAAGSSVHKKQHLKIGYCSTSVNRQFDYDHRFDDALYMDRGLKERKLVSLRVGFEQYKELAKQYAGPAVIEIFGETPFEPKNKEDASKHSEKQKKLSVEYQRDASIITNEYINSEEYSFTIIAYPIPEIGDDFEAIFEDTVKVNTLDVTLYEQIQQKIIDALDQGVYVKILGMGENRTDLKVMLADIKNPEKETNFENCLADVNIPVGEVFTSPKLTGTCGILHVSEVYLRDLKYDDLELQFEDGKIIDYHCKNFKEEDVLHEVEANEASKWLEKKNRDYIKENLLYQHETLPIGEFAIGTNTTAYAMGRKYHISHKLPILIAEKTGPHFAIGDTCFKMSEDVKVYNPNGKEITAKDNECSILRKTQIEKAYFNCHTDITIPYHELGELSVYTKNKTCITIIQNGRFVLEGTEELNKPFED